MRVPALLGAVHGCCSDRWLLCNCEREEEEDGITNCSVGIGALLVLGIGFLGAPFIDGERSRRRGCLGFGDDWGLLGQDADKPRQRAGAGEDKPCVCLACQPTS